MRNFEDAGDIVSIVKDFKNANQQMMKKILREKDLEKDFGELKDLDDKERQNLAESINELHTQNMKILAIRMRQLTKNMEKL